ncbi:MAG: AI-2E family transporter [Actinomycetota bacterium]|nr:AI-2E family transporter [Actinomycetota bacterium]
MPAERVVLFRVRTVLMIVTTVVAVAIALEVLWLARHVLTWVFVALFLAIAMNPLVEILQRRFVHRRGLAAALTYVLVLLVLVGIGFSFIPTLVSQMRDLVDALPGYVHDLTHGRGRLGFLQTKYHLVDKVREAVKNGGAAKVFGLSGTAIAVTKGVITIIVATLTIAFMTFFMLLEGPKWVERVYGLMGPEQQRRWRRVGSDIYRTVGGYVTGNLLISLIAGGSSTVVLLIMGVPYAVALGLVVAILDLIPLAGATLALLLVGTVAFLHSIVAGIVVVVFFIVYQQVENHFLQPVIYSRTVQLSPLVVLVSVLLGAELAGVLGALGAIPLAGTMQVLLVDWLRHRREQEADLPPPPLPEPAET